MESLLMAFYIVFKRDLSLRKSFSVYCNNVVEITSQSISIDIEGTVHLNIIFSYMKFNKICNLDHPVN